MKQSTKMLVYSNALLLILGVGIFYTHPGFAWTNPSSNPPLGSKIINISGNKVGVGTTNPFGVLESSTDLDIPAVRGYSTGASGVGVNGESTASGAGAGVSAKGWRGVYAESTDLTGGWAGYFLGRGYFSGNVGVGTTGLDTNYRITTSGGGIKAGNSSATQPAGYFSNGGGGPAITIGTGGITLGGVNQTAWPIAAATTWASVTSKSLGDTARNDSTLDIGTSQYLRWKHYSNSHVIIDASNSTAPSGAAINNTNAQVSWTSTYPTLMGWNGTNTYGVRVDSARVADSATDTTKVSKTGDTISGELDATGGTGTAYNTAPIEIRTTLTPRISFHRPGLVASQIGMDSAGIVRTYDNPGTGYEKFAAARIDANSMSGSGGFISTGNYGGTGNAAYFPSGLWSNGTSAWIYGTISTNGAIVDTSSRMSLNPAGITYFNGGNVGIGTSAPGAKLHVAGLGFMTSAMLGKIGVSSTAVLDVYNPAPMSAIAKFRNSSDTAIMVVQDDGKVGIGPTDPVLTLGALGKLTVNSEISGGKAIYGTASGVNGIGVYGEEWNGAGYGVYCNAPSNVNGCGGNRAWYNASDERLKENIYTIEGALSKVNSLRGVEYTWKNDTENRKQIGFIAQEALPIVPEIVGKGPDGYYSMSYGSITPLLVESIKEQQKQIEQQGKDIEDLKKALAR